MLLGHLGILVFITGITLTSVYSAEKDLRLEPGQTYSLGGYDFEFLGVQHSTGANYEADQGQVIIRQSGKEIATLYPEKRAYATGMPMTEAGIDAGITRDLFVALGEPLGDEGAWSVRIYHKPFIRWIWLGALIMSFGGLVSVSDPRYRKLARQRKLDKRAVAAA